MLNRSLTWVDINEKWERWRLWRESTGLSVRNEQHNGLARIFRSHLINDFSKFTRSFFYFWLRVENFLNLLSLCSCLCHHFLYLFGILNVNEAEWRHLDWLFFHDIFGNVQKGYLSLLSRQTSSQTETIEQKI